MICAAVLSAVAGSQTRRTQGNDWHQAVMDTEDCTPAPRRKGKSEPYAPLCWASFLFNGGSCTRRSVPKGFGDVNERALSLCACPSDTGTNKKTEMHCHRLDGWKISPAPMPHTGKCGGFFCRLLLFLLYWIASVNVLCTEAAAGWLQGTRPRLPVVTSSVIPLFWGSLQTYRRWALQAGLCQTCTACLLFSSFCVFTSQCALSAIKCQTQYPNSHWISPYPCKGLVEASWAAPGTGVWYKVIWISSCGSFYLSSLDLSSLPSVL